MNERVKKQMEFILEVDKLKQIFRQSLISDGSRRENDAEHSWHASFMCMLLAEYAPDGTDVFKSAHMLLIHDLVEIYAGDTYLYDENANADRNKREKEAALKLYSILPDDQRDEYISLWEEFEAKETKEAVYAGYMDRIQPLMLNYATKGERWKFHKVTKDIVFPKIEKALMGAPKELYEYAFMLLNESVEKGYLPEK